ncbi:uncharacterized protein SCHCODRAFT_02598163 [Schizophyllum commune H4-8]|uniref:SAP domain-containing protein n=1 Tax=Schizophyllum commune (strain H4-8 / FGSC 9210) TaxID=578458 RepID=D8Q3B5_SCHCM|nr:uncharacterized protein SCHCODRAFT_02598163 [Schizophyllum commune H4-8]KAI5894819.1 hypothetical protein SCHCODRAFT_02598163 [Schizophyllum commune H4-8]
MSVREQRHCEAAIWRARWGEEDGARDLDLVPRRVAGRHVTSPAFGSYRFPTFSANVHHIGDRVDLDRAAGAHDALVAALDPAANSTDPCALYAAANDKLHRQLLVYVVLASFLAALLVITHRCALALPIYVLSRILNRFVKHLTMAVQRTKRKRDKTEDLLFPVPGRFKEDGQLMVESVDISALTVKQMKERLRAYTRPITGNSEILKQRLREFSADRSAWDVLLPSISSNLKVLRVSKPKVKRAKSWKMRRHNMFGDGDDAEDGQHRVAKVDEGLLAAAARIRAANPYRPPIEYLRRMSNPSHVVQEPVDESDSRAAGLVPPPVAAPAAVPNAQDIVQGVLNGLLQHQLPPTMTAATLNGPAQSDAVSATTRHNGPLRSGGEHALASTSSPINAKSPASSPPPRRTLHLPPLATCTNNGLLLEFTDDDVQAPAGGIGSDVERIACMWTFDSYWRRDSPLTIHGHPIPLSIWPELFNHRKPELWTYYKSHYIKWRDVAMAWRRFDSPEKFWEKYSIIGGMQRKRQTFTQIANEVMKAWKDTTRTIVARARAEYGDGDTFAAAFSYWKGNTMHTLRNDTGIARRYVELLRQQGRDADAVLEADLDDENI